MGRPYVINHPPRIVRDFLFVSSEDDHMFFYKKNLPNPCLFYSFIAFFLKIYDGEKWWPAAGRFRCPVIPTNNPSSIWIRNYSASFSS